MRDRGGGWVIGQFALLALIFLAVLVPPRWPDAVATPFAVAGAVLAIAGAAVVVWTARTMGKGLTPFPEPPEGARLVEEGPFRYVRHPTYSGGSLFLLGWSLYAGPVALVLSVALLVLWVGKLRTEEARLRTRFGGYEEYAARVPSRLVPGVY